MNLILLSGSLFMTAVLLLTLEGALRLIGLGDVDEAKASRLKYQRIDLPIMEPGERPDGTAIWRTTDQRLPYQSILAEKPENALRVFTFGGSATAGLGFSPNVTFARELERMLVIAYPERQVEVVNLGIVALAARQVKVLVRDVCLNYEPDVILVYSGNNEFLEIHAEKYAELHGNLLTSIRDRLLQTNLYRLVDRAVRGGPQTPSMASQDISGSDLRVSESTLIQDIEMRPEEISEIVDRYEQTIDTIARIALGTETPVLLMTVASNWKWRGREDLPKDWLDEVVPDDGTDRPERLRLARERLGERIESSSHLERYELRFQRALAAESLGEFDAARTEYRASMNEDPHLRRALDALGERVRRVAAARRVPVLDVIDRLSEEAAHGIVGFDEFYDYVHFTPRGVALVAADSFVALREAGVLPPAEGFDPEAHLRQRLDELAALEEDPLAVDEWLGFGFEPAGIRDRDLWKYDRLLSELDERIESDPDDVRALVFRGNAHAFKVDGADRATRDYEAALALGDDPTIRRNLSRLHRDRRP